MIAIKVSLVIFCLHQYHYLLPNNACISFSQHMEPPHTVFLSLFLLYKEMKWGWVGVGGLPDFCINEAFLPIVAFEI